MSENEEGQGSQSNEWEARYRELQSRYDGDTAILNQRLNELSQQFRALSENNEELRRQATAKTFEPEKLKNAGYEEELIKVISNQDSKIATLERELQNVKGIKDRTDKIESEKCWDEFTRLYPNWEVVNNDPKFRKFLGEIDPKSGMTRAQLLESAKQGMRAKGIAAIFQEFEQERNKNKPQQNISPSNTGVQQAKGGQRVYTRAEIKRFFQDVALGRYSENDARAIEQDIGRAQFENRIAN